MCVHTQHVCGMRYARVCLVFMPRLCAFVTVRASVLHAARGACNVLQLSKSCCVCVWLWLAVRSVGHARRALLMASASRGESPACPCHSLFYEYGCCLSLLCCVPVPLGAPTRSAGPLCSALALALALARRFPLGFHPGSCPVPGVRCPGAVCEFESLSEGILGS